MSSQSLESLMDNFIQFQKEEKGERTFETYGRKIYVFQEYLERQGVDDITYAPFLYKVQIKDILDAIRYYVETYDIKFKSTTDTFLAALSVFFKFIQERHGIRNEYFEENSKVKDLKTSYDELVKELKLNDSLQATPLTDDECEKLVRLCNEKLDNPSIDEIVNGNNNGVYSFYISSLITKFVLLFGTKNKVINELCVDAYDHELNKITIRGYNVHLPDGLARQMRKYLKVREEIVPVNAADNRLFVDITPGQKLDNAKMFFVLKGITGNAKAMSVAKYAIIQMLKNGLPVNLVMDFTGYSKSVYGHCQELIDEENGIFQLSEKNRKLDSLLRQSRVFDDL